MTTVKKLLQLAIQIHGVDAQWNKLQEECAELIAAINHRRLERISLEQLAEEVADVMIMCEQAREMLGERVVDDARNRKLERLRLRLNDPAWRG